MTDDLTSPDLAPVDLDGDDTADAAGLDADGDGYLDIVVEQTPIGAVAYVDTDGDGTLETVVEDLDGDGRADVLDVDTDGDGWTDLHVDLTGDGSEGGYTPGDLGVAPPMGGDPGPSISDPLILDPTWTSTLPPDAQTEAQWWQQQTENGYCGPTSVAMVVSEFVGHPVDAGVFVESAKDLQLLAGEPGDWEGMTAGQIETLLEAYDVPSSTEVFGTEPVAEAALAEALAQNVGVIALVDSSEIWDEVDDDRSLTDVGMDHAVVVVGMDDSFVYLNDPGTPDGQLMPVAREVFFDAWSDSDFVALVTEVAPGQELDSPWVAAAQSVQAGDVGALDDATRVLDEAVQPAIVFDPTIASSGAPVWLLPLVLPASALGLAAARALGR